MLVTVLLLMSGCGQGTTSSSDTSETSERSKVASTEETSTDMSTAGTTNSIQNSESIDWVSAEGILQEHTEAKKITTIFQQDQAIENKNEQASVTINGYRYLEIEEFSRDLKIPFGDQREKGGVLLIAATYKNMSNSSIYAGPGFSMSVVGYASSINRNNSLMENDLVSRLTEVNNELEPHQEIFGYLALPVKPEAMAKIEEYGVAEIELPGFYNQADSFSKEDAVLESMRTTIALSDKGVGAKEDAAAFYEDKVTRDNMGTKTALVEKELNKTETFEDIAVTMEGYQIVSFEPNEDEKARFQNFETGVILLTAKVIVKNNGNEALNVDSTSGTLTIGNSIKMMNETMLQVDSGADQVEKGQEATKYLVFTLDKESYEKLYKEQEYLLDVSLYDTEFARLTDIDDLAFEFSN